MMTSEAKTVAAPAQIIDDIGVSKLARDTDTWLEDGNIVLVAGTRAFRVYKGLLAAQSSMFADMFFASRPQADELFEGCPVVRLSDSPEELKHLLDVLIPNVRQRVYFPDEEHYTFTQLSSFVRLGHKYGIVDVEQQALACLKTYFTNKFDLWESFCPGLFGYRHAALCLSSGIEAIHLARLTATPEMLPVAFYICALRGEAVLDGWTRADGTVEHLAPEDLRRAIKGFGTLRFESHRLLTDQFDVTVSVTCTTPAICNLILGRNYLCQLDDRSPWPLHPWQQYISLPDLCKQCSYHLTEHSRAERRKLWRRLPAIFDLLNEHGLEWEIA
ncbi:hypothetical protein VTO73DRAFT_15345 [Trametes versicolor]